IQGAPDPFARQIHLLHLLSQTLKMHRESSGSIDFDFSTPQIRLDDDGVPISIRPAERLSANRMVEECMLLANRLVAEKLSAHTESPGVYRVHSVPRESDVNELIGTLERLGIQYTAGTGAADYRAILSIIQNFEFRDLVESLASKALSKAVYSTQNQGHFGLAMEAYTHFTSPIRRYPDVVVHRLIKRIVRKEAEQKGRSGRGRPARGLMEFLEKTCVHANERERAATDAEREYSRLKALEFLQTKIGRTYEGVVSGVASIGLFVEIEKYLIEGLVHRSSLGKERLEFDRTSYRLVGQTSGTTFTLGDRMTVTVTAVDVQARTATFVPAGSKEPTGTPRTPRKRQERRGRKSP
ncbi:MAG: RNB domain-containing ribonuclease, partial [Spirochaetales bacterium]